MTRLTEVADYDDGETSGNVPSPQSNAGNTNNYYGRQLRTSHLRVWPLKDSDRHVSTHTHRPAVQLVRFDEAPLPSLLPAYLPNSSGWLLPPTSGSAGQLHDRPTRVFGACLPGSHLAGFPLTLGDAPGLFYQDPSVSFISLSLCHPKGHANIFSLPFDTVEIFFLPKHKHDLMLFSLRSMCRSFGRPKRCPELSLCSDAHLLEATWLDGLQDKQNVWIFLLQRPTCHLEFTPFRMKIKLAGSTK
ncbi:unnamed protein product [Protopolystoma xenopodis]|uniref:Uncharacterized protein n=1 Tax=Protopolystoma xenopodis TaxID=117903 RepID=A0A3S5B9B4_9PLAT|nr:unnamed protein product [Protopolystoma xenopodis]